MASSATAAAPRGSCLAAVLAVAALAASARGLGASAAASGGSNWHVMSVSALLPGAACSTAPKAATSASNSSALRVVHRHGPCSPLLSRGGAPSHAEILDRDQDRVNSIHRKVSGASAANPARASKGVSLPAHRGISLGTANYVVTVGLGTPARDFSVIFDTGSDLSWVQCDPCSGCYAQQDPLFDQTRSSTYAVVRCGDPVCRELDAGSCTSDDKCRYEVVYGDQSQTDGDLARDTLTLAPSETLPGFVFGCGDENQGLFGRVDGLFGLGRQKTSLASQAAAKYGPGFSYCLPSTSSAEGYLSLGGGCAPVNARFTPMLARRDTPSFYYLNLVGIKVGGRSIRVPPTVFTTPGTVIDSGTVITRLPASAYAALRASFVRYMGRYKKAPALSILDTCYDFTGHERVQIPTVALVFAGGATVSLDFTGVMYVSKVSQVCLGFASNGDDTSLGILGNTQQRTLAVVYDVANQRIGFGERGCS